jgi:hypothetical protein
MKKTRIAIELAMLICIAAFASGQATPTVHQTAARSSCSNIVALSGAKVDCSNLTPAQKKALESIPAIMKMAIENQDYLETIMKRLAEMPAGQPVINSAPGGFAISGGTLVNPQVTNLGPPPVTVRWIFDPNHQPAPSSSGHPLATVIFWTDRNDEMGQFAVTCDRPCLADSMCVLLGHSPGLAAHIEPDETAENENIATFFFLSPFPANFRCNLTVESQDDKPVKILKVATLELRDTGVPQ